MLYNVNGFWRLFCPREGIKTFCHGFIPFLARGAISSTCYELKIDIIESTITTITCIEHLFYINRCSVQEIFCFI
jgi:hypothetical protein